jgi:CheY-like chemotaxis protein
MDLYLTAMNGFKTTEAIHATAHYRDHPVPIIALTSNTLMESKPQFLKSTGFTDYINKPPRKDTFAALVKKYLPPPKLASLEWY